MRRAAAVALVALVAFASTSAALAEGLPSAVIDHTTLAEKVAAAPAAPKAMMKGEEREAET